jgi:hypothetical protein
MEVNIKIGLLILCVIFLYSQGQAQQSVVQDSAMHREEQKNKKADTSSLLYAFKKGKVNGYLRYFFMATDNTNGLSDYYANAIGGGLKYETSSYKGFQLGISGFFVYNIGSSDLSLPDPETNQFNRYEIGLFDVSDPGNKSNLYRLEELYLKYSWKKSYIAFGKQLLNTPFINLQDGRMRPTSTEGIWAEIKDIKNTKIETGFLYRMSPRSTVSWYSIGESFGLYPSGVNMDGTKSAYADNIESSGIWLLGNTHTLQKSISL